MQLIVCAGESESFDSALPVGIGLVDVAINLTRYILEYDPKEILFVGTCGSYGNHNIFDTVYSSNSSQIEHSLLLNTSYSPISNKIVSHETDPMINSSNYITTDEKISKLYIEKGIELENMEFYSVVKVAKTFKIDAKGIFVVTNYCNSKAHKDFVNNHKRAKEMLNEIIKGKN